MIKIKRVYDKPKKDDGFRILVDRLWPRGLSKDKAKVDLWLKDIGPSDKLRKWFSHKEERWLEFKKRYEEELKEKGELIKKIKELQRDNTVVLLFGAKDKERNNAVVLKEFIEDE